MIVKYDTLGHSILNEMQSTLSDAACVLEIGGYLTSSPQLTKVLGTSVSPRCHLIIREVKLSVKMSQTVLLAYRLNSLHSQVQSWL